MRKAESREQRHEYQIRSYCILLLNVIAQELKQCDNNSRMHIGVLVLDRSRTDA